MATTRSNPDQYLQKVGGTYYARVRVPRTLEKLVGQSHIRRSLKTGERASANRAKHAMVGQIKAELDRLRTMPKDEKGHGLSNEDAKRWRDSLLAAQKEDDDEEQNGTVAGLIAERAEQLEQLHGTAKARRWYKTATTTTDTLSELMEQWLGVSDYRESTKAGHRKALNEVLEYLQDNQAVPADVTRTVAIKYIDTVLTQRNLAHTTLRDKLVSLGGFWGWMESREAVPPGMNPWTGHKLSKQKNKGTRPPKRAYTNDELLKLLKGNTQVNRWPTYSYLPDLMVLGLFTGAREDEICSLTASTVELKRTSAILHVTDAKTKAGIRFVAVTHPAPLAVLKRRLKGLKGDEQVFPELTPGGLDEKLSSSAVKAFGRYRRACGVPDGTDFHSFRRNVITVLENVGVDQVAIARFVGHKVGTLAGDTYSEGGTSANAALTSKKIRFAKLVESTALSLAVT